MGVTKIKIMVADDHLFVIESIINRLKQEDNFSIIGLAKNGKELIDLIAKDEPDIVLIDLEMPVMGGAEAVRIIASRYPKIKPVMLSGYYSDYFVSELVNLGVCGYISKNFDTDEVILTINKVYQDGYYFSKKVAHLLISEQERKNFDKIMKQISLTDREIEILKEICKGKSNKEIALKLNITYDTVDFHRKNIYKKTNSSNIVALIKYAIKNGIADLDDTSLI